MAITQPVEKRETERESMPLLIQSQFTFRLQQQSATTWRTEQLLLFFSFFLSFFLLVTTKQPMNLIPFECTFSSSIVAVVVVVVVCSNGE